MRRPATTKLGQHQPTTFRPSIAEGLTRYFQHFLDHAKAVKSSGQSVNVTWPTVRGFCLARGINHNTMRGWARSKPEMRSALTACAQIRFELSKLELASLVFDTEHWRQQHDLVA